jgi:hypothetical protein
MDLITTNIEQRSTTHFGVQSIILGHIRHRCKSRLNVLDAANSTVGNKITNAAKPGMPSQPSRFDELPIIELCNAIHLSDITGGNAQRFLT